MTLHDELDLLADTAPRPAIDHTLWDQGRALRRRDRIVTSALVLAVVVILGGLTSIVLGPPRAFSPADDVMPEGAIPSVIRDVPVDTDLPIETDLAIGRASVAFYSAGGIPTVIGATDGRYHLLDLPGLPEGPEAANPAFRTARGPLALSPDGTRLAWRSTELVHVANLLSGEVTDLAPFESESPSVSELVWRPDSARLLWRGRIVDGKIAGEIDVTTRVEDLFARREGKLLLRGAVSPDKSMLALPTASLTDSSVPFLAGLDGPRLQRTLPADLYPGGAAVVPLGWANDDLVLAIAIGSPGSYVEGEHLVLFTSPDRPTSEWTYRILIRDLPLALAADIAVDLIPDLDGTTDQQLTHDFGDPEVPGDSPWRDRLPEILGGIAALLAGLAYIRMLRRQ